MGITWELAVLLEVISILKTVTYKLYYKKNYEFRNLTCNNFEAL